MKEREKGLTFPKPEEGFANQEVMIRDNPCLFCIYVMTTAVEIIHIYNRVPFLVTAVYEVATSEERDFTDRR